MSQETKILKHLKSGKSITPLQALRNYGCMRLGARILELRDKGFNIVTKRITRNKKNYASYSLEK